MAQDEKMAELLTDSGQEAPSDEQDSCSATYPALLVHLDDAVELLDELLTRHSCPMKVRNQLGIALEELFVNVCSYAYADKPEPGPVTVRYTCAAGDHGPLTVHLIDQGVYFDPASKDDPDLPTSIDETKIGGLGIFMTKRMMDSFSFQRVGDQNIVTFTKSW
jgi:anti-sigma regulatory factor (Ser/Thr protein kinase)